MMNQVDSSSFDNDRCDKKLNDLKGDEVVVIDGVEGEPVVEAEVQVEAKVEAEAEVQVEGEVEVGAEVEVEGQVDAEPQVQLDEEGLVEVEVQVQEEAGGVGDMEVVVECIDDIHVGVDGKQIHDRSSAKCSFNFFSWCLPIFKFIMLLFHSETSRHYPRRHDL